MNKVVYHIVIPPKVMSVPYATYLALAYMAHLCDRLTKNTEGLVYKGGPRVDPNPLGERLGVNQIGLDASR